MHKVIHRVNSLLNRPGLLLIPLLLVSFIIRVNNFDYPIDNGEKLYPYMVARYINHTGQFIATGTNTSVWSEVKLSPLYFYVVAALLRVSENLLFVAAVSIIIQLATLLCMFALAYLLFDNKSALLTMALMGISYLNREQSSFLKEPYLMQFFIFACYTCLALGYRKKQSLFVYASLSLLVVSIAIYISALMIVPVYILALVLLITKGNVRVSLVWAITIVFFSLVFAYGSSVLYAYSHGAGLAHGFQTIIGSVNISPVDMIRTLHRNISEFFQPLFFIYKDGAPLNIQNLALYSSFSFILCAFFWKKSTKYTVIYILLIIAIVSGILMNTLVRNAVGDFHFTPLFGLFIILASHAFTFVSIRSTFFSVLKTLLLINFAVVITLDPSSLVFQSHQRHRLAVEAATEVIAADVRLLQKERTALTSPHFFQLTVVREGSPSRPNEPLIFWILLEDLFRTPFGTIDETQGINLRLINSDTVVFLICNYLPDTNIAFWHAYRGYDINESLRDEECLRTFTSTSRHRIVNHLFASYPYSIYRAEKPEDIKDI